MERTKKHQKRNVASVDRLSDLSDDILAHILSFLPTKLSVSTSILAKRWRFLWAHVPSLRFEGEISVDVIYRFMVLHKPKTINTFSLSDMPHCNEYQLVTWIKTAIDHNVQKLHLLRVKGILPQCIFTSKTLVDMRIEECVGTLSGGSPVYLPSLKRLYLHGFTYLVDDALTCLLSGCPVLEELCIIKGTMGPDFLGLYISSPLMKRLEIDFQTVNPKTPCEVRVTINTPRLRYLKIYMGYIQQLSFSPMKSLLQVDMCLYRCTVSTSRLLNSFPNVKCLKLSGGRCKFSEVSGSVVHFDCLTKLEFGFSVDWDDLVKILEIAHKLQVLITHQVTNKWTKWIEPTKGCISHSLKTLKILGFGCTEKELCMLKYVLRKAIALKRVEIYAGSSDVDLEAKFEAVKRILLFHRGSECEVAFY